MDTSRLFVFAAASLALLLTPGPAVLYIITRSLDQGRRAGLISVLSIESGNFMHVLAAAFGVSALVAASPALFVILKFLGAAYLVYLGVRKLLERTSQLETSALVVQDSRRIYSQGFIVAVLNPKTALFFLAFLPQFVNPGQGSIPLQMLTLGFIFLAMACVTDSLYALVASQVGHWLRTGKSLPYLQRYLVGGIYIGLGLAAALAGANLGS